MYIPLAGAMGIRFVNEEFYEVEIFHSVLRADSDGKHGRDARLGS
jgi:hypothetical protein